MPLHDRVASKTTLMASFGEVNPTNDYPRREPLRTQLVIAGPTCIGKTSYVLELTKLYPFEIVNVDSFQIYSHFRIGTGRADMMFERSHLYGFRNPHEVLGPSEYIQLVKAALQGIRTRNNFPLFEGGSITYLKALADHYALTIIGLKSFSGDWSKRMIIDRIRSYNEEDLIDEIRAGLDLGFRNTRVMQDDVIYLPYVEYCEGKVSLAAARERVVKNLVIRHEEQINQYQGFNVHWFYPTKRFLDEVKPLVEEVLSHQKDD